MKKNVRILIVEDEFVTLDAIQDDLEEVGYDVSGTAMNVSEALEVLEKGNTDIAILDIQLRGEKNGVWLGEKIKEQYKIPFIYLTAYSDTATVEAAAKTEPSAYLIKPFKQGDLFAAIEVAISNFGKKTKALHLSASHEKVTEELMFNEAIFIKENSVFKKLVIRDILYVEAVKNYLAIHTEDSSYNIRATLKEFGLLLPAEYFVQTHRSYIVNINAVTQITGNSLLVKESDIPMTRSHKDQVLKRLKFYY